MVFFRIPDGKALSDCTSPLAVRRKGAGAADSAVEAAECRFSRGLRGILFAAARDPVILGDLREAQNLPFPAGGQKNYSAYRVIIIQYILYHVLIFISRENA